MKPRLIRTPGFPPYSGPQWWCTGGGALGIGLTPSDAYTVWVRSQMNRANSAQAWVQRPTKPPSRFERWLQNFEGVF